MRPGLKKEILRSNTNYRLARRIVDGIFVAEMLVCAVGTIYGLRFAVVASADPGMKLGNYALMFGAWTIILVVCAAIVMAALAWLKRELLQSWFDVADAQMEKYKSEPFRE